ncbi:MAG TPA: hypothetical protein VGH72_01870 [Pseudonocardia sp.]|nr:hypothetical protein [Pseudonocardiales bacterium]MDT7665912.1 hypothetical protein [Pseudonocardiales bacterium]
MRAPERLLRATGGALAAGLTVLAVAMLGVWALAFSNDDPGPRARLLVAHLVAAVLAVLLQRVADRRADRVGRAAAGGVLLVALVVSVVFWWT